MNHLLSENFERHNPKKSKKPLRATVSSRLKSKLSLSSDQEGDLNGPRSLPSQFIPRAPIPPPAVLAKKKSSDRERNRINNEAILAKDQLYQSPKERDGDYSYAYDCSISPAVVIKWTEDSEEEDSETEVNKQEKSTKVKSNNQAENIYEEIQDLSLHQLNSDGSASSSVNNSDSGIGHGGAGQASLSSASGSKGSSSASSAGSKGTLDVSSKQNRHKNKQKLSSLDTLISQVRFQKFEILRTVFENHRKVSFNVASEASYVYILIGQKFIKNANNFRKPKACSQILLPDMSLLIGQKLAENAKIQKFKCDILSNFQTLCRKAIFKW